MNIIFRSNETSTTGTEWWYPANFKKTVEIGDDRTQFFHELPGVKKEDIVVKIEGNEIKTSVKLEAKIPHSDQCFTYMRIDTLNNNEDPEGNVTAKFENGLLTITVPHKKKKINEVKIS